MNITLSADERIIARARKAAQSMGISLNEAVLGFSRDLVGEPSREDEIVEIEQLSKQSHGQHRGWKFDRDEIHEHTQLSQFQHSGLHR